MNRQRRARSPLPPFAFDPRMIGRGGDPRMPPEYEDSYPPMAPFEPNHGGAPNFIETPTLQGPQPCASAFREHRLPSTYRATLRESQPHGPPAAGQPTPYKILCITNISPKVADGLAREALKNDFSIFGDISVTICHDNGERLAYIYFRSYEEAREAKHSKSRTILFDRPIEIEPIYEPRPSPVATPPSPHVVPHVPIYPRRRSMTPPDYFDIADPHSAVELNRRPPNSNLYHRGPVSPPQPGYTAPIPHHYPSHRQSSPGPVPYGYRYYMAQPVITPQSPYSSPSHEPYPSRQPYHQPVPFGPPGQPNHIGTYGSSGPRDPRERLFNEGHMRSPRHEQHFPLDNTRDHLIGPHYPPSRSPHMQASLGHHHSLIPPDAHGSHTGHSVRHVSPPRYHDHPRYTSREFRREKFSGDMSHGDPDDGKPSRVLFITNIDPSKTDSELKSIFDPYGTIEDIEMRKISSETASAILKFSSMDCAYKAKTALHGKYLGKVKCRILYGTVSASKRLWIGGFSSNTTMVRLEDEFGRFGEIVNLDYISGRPYAYIEYESANQALFATQHLKGTFAADAERRIRIEYVDPVKNDKTLAASHSTPDTITKPRNTEESWASNVREATSQSHNLKRSITPPDINTKRIPLTVDESSNSHLQDDWEAKNADASVEENFESDRNEHSDFPTHKNQDDQLLQKFAQCRGIGDIANCCTVSWFGKLVLRNFTFFSKMFLFSGRREVIEKYITKLGDHDRDRYPILSITQRWRLHPQPKLEEVKRRMQMGNLGMMVITPKLEYPSPTASSSSPANKTPQSSSSSTAIPASKQNGDKYENPFDERADTVAVSESSPSTQSRPLKNLISYLEQKDAAGVISLSAIDQDNRVIDGSGDSKTLYIFPPGDFAFNLLKKKAPNLNLDTIREEFLLGVIVGVAETKI